ncbi:MAG: DUF1439 domain-containing protein [Comamonadaceae bacterium]|nr:DUF1439 domain-containing protein [Comamonadaceae bacterium]
MSRRIAALATALLAALALATCAVVSRVAGDHLDIERAELQARIEARFPTQHCKLLVACLDLSRPEVVLTEGEDRIGLNADATLRLGGREQTGRVGFSGRPRYVPEQGQLFLDDLQITTLEFPGVSEAYIAAVKLRGPVLIHALLGARPVYTLDAGTTKGALAKLAVRDVKVVNGKLRISFALAGRE